MKTLLSGDRPSGSLHLGHLLGSLEARVSLQSQFNSYFLIADIQAHTDNYLRPEEIKAFALDLVKDYISVGINPSLSSIVLQSSLTPLLELTQILSHFTNLNHLKQNPTLKTELAQRKVNNLSFLSYPVSQAADILGFGAEVIPVGIDQTPIIEFTNTLAKGINQHFKTTLLSPCEALLSPVSRLKGVDGSSKMSKSMNNCIFLKDSADEVKKKVYKMFTDPSHIHVHQPGKIEGNVVVYFLDILDPRQAELADLKAQYQTGGVADIMLKNRLVDIINARLEPIRAKRKELNDNAYLLNILKQGQADSLSKINKVIKPIKELFYLSL